MIKGRHEHPEMHAETYKKELPHMRRFSRLTRAVLIPVAALTILVGSAVPASAATPNTAGSSVAAPQAQSLIPRFGTLSISW
jgi:hypothetical protein